MAMFDLSFNIKKMVKKSCVHLWSVFNRILTFVAVMILVRYVVLQITPCRWSCDLLVMPGCLRM